MGHLRTLLYLLLVAALALAYRTLFVLARRRVVEGEVGRWGTETVPGELGRKM